jgi:hypothetical protein
VKNGFNTVSPLFGSERCRDSFSIAAGFRGIGLADFKQKAGDRIGFEKGNAPMRALPRKSLHRRKPFRAELGDRAIDVGDARRNVVKADVPAHDAPGEARIAFGILQQLDQRSRQT